MEIIVPEEYSEVRLDKVISALTADGLSRTRIKRLITEGGVRVGGDTVSKASAPVSFGDLIEFDIPPEIPFVAEAEDIPLSILYEDDDVLVVDKPKGMVVHPAAGHSRGTLVNAVMFHCGDSLSGIGGVLRPGIVHRIDKDTTGSIMVCKNDAAHLSLSAQLKEHSVTREYEAIVYGIVKDDQGTVDAPVGRSRTDRKKMAVDPSSGRAAVTHYRVINRFERDRFTHIACTLESGRTHQIRVHMSYIGHPVLGDPLYAGGRSSRFRTEGQCLHARILGFTHPVSGERITTEAPLPAYFTHLLEILG